MEAGDVLEKELQGNSNIPHDSQEETEITSESELGGSVYSSLICFFFITKKKKPRHAPQKEEEEALSRACTGSWRGSMQQEEQLQTSICEKNGNTTEVHESFCHFVL